MITWPLVAYLMINFGWVYAFYVPAVLALFVAVLWFYIVYNSPHSHPRISDHELKFIEASQGNSVSHSKVKKISLDRYILDKKKQNSFFCLFIKERTATNLLHFEVTPILCALPSLFWTCMVFLLLLSCCTEILK